MHSPASVISTCRLWFSQQVNSFSLTSCSPRWRPVDTKCSSFLRWCAAWTSWKTTSSREGENRKQRHAKGVMLLLWTALAVFLPSSWGLAANCDVPLYYICFRYITVYICHFSKQSNLLFWQEFNATFCLHVAHVPYLSGPLYRALCCWAPLHHWCHMTVLCIG